MHIICKVPFGCSFYNIIPYRILFFKPRANLIWFSEAKKTFTGWKPMWYVVKTDLYDSFSCRKRIWPLSLLCSMPLNRPGGTSSVDVAIRKCVRKLHSRVQRSISMTSPVTTAYTRQQPEQLLKLLSSAVYIEQLTHSCMSHELQQCSYQ